MNCSSDSNNEFERMSYNGAGSIWNIDFTSNTQFAVTYTPSGSTPGAMIINGTYVPLPSGLVELTVGTVEPPSHPDAPPIGAVDYGLEIDGYAFFLQPVSSQNEVITMVQAGSCPTSSFTSNWTTAKNQVTNTVTGAVTPIDVSANDDAIFGTFAWDSATNIATLPGNYTLASPTTIMTDQLEITMNCTDGISNFTTSDGGAGKMFLTTGGGAIVHVQENNSLNDTTDDLVITAFPTEQLMDINNIDGVYTGIFADNDPNSQNPVQFFTATCTNGDCPASIINPATGVITSSGATINLTGTVNDPSEGFINGTLDAGANSGNISCMVDTNANNTGKTLINCSGQLPDNNTMLFNITMASQ